MASMKTSPGLVNFFIYNSTFAPKEGMVCYLIFKLLSRWIYNLLGNQDCKSGINCLEKKVILSNSQEEYPFCKTRSLSSLTVEKYCIVHCLRAGMFYFFCCKRNGRHQHTGYIYMVQLISSGIRLGNSCHVILPKIRSF